ncbi:MAG: hypothetical protein CMG85_23600 [Marinobacter sp.]|nr:hypothetical protein [Marinobacter sp.]
MVQLQMHETWSLSLQEQLQEIELLQFLIAWKKFILFQMALLVLIQCSSKQLVVQDILLLLLINQ